MPVCRKTERGYVEYAKKFFPVLRWVFLQCLFRTSKRATDINSIILINVPKGSLT